MNYASTLQSWHDFYSIVGMAAGSLVGLLFVGLSLHLRIVVSRADVRALARVTLASLGLGLILALFMVIPETHDPSSTGWNLVGLGAFGCLLISRSIYRGVRSSSHTIISFPRLILRFGFATVTFLTIIAMGGLLVGGDYQDAFSGLVAVSVVLLVGALRNSWDLLVSVGDVAYGAEAPQAPAGAGAHQAAP
jgi:hypothetical protein